MLRYGHVSGTGDVFFVVLFAEVAGTVNRAANLEVSRVAGIGLIC